MGRGGSATITRVTYVTKSWIAASDEVTAGGVIPAQDYDVLAARARLTSFFLYKAGVAAIFGPGTPVAYSAKVVMQLLMQE